MTNTGQSATPTTTPFILKMFTNSKAYEIEGFENPSSNLLVVYPMNRGVEDKEEVMLAKTHIAEKQEMRNYLIDELNRYICMVGNMYIVHRTLRPALDLKVDCDCGRRKKNILESVAVGLHIVYVFIHINIYI